MKTMITQASRVTAIIALGVAGGLACASCSTTPSSSAAKARKVEDVANPLSRAVTQYPYVIGVSQFSQSHSDHFSHAAGTIETLIATHAAADALSAYSEHWTVTVADATRPCFDISIEGCITAAGIPGGSDVYRARIDAKDAAGNVILSKSYTSQSIEFADGFSILASDLVRAIALRPPSIVTSPRGTAYISRLAGHGQSGAGQVVDIAPILKLPAPAVQKIAEDFRSGELAFYQTVNAKQREALGRYLKLYNDWLTAREKPASDKAGHLRAGKVGGWLGVGFAALGSGLGIAGKIDPNSAQQLVNEGQKLSVQGYDDVQKAVAITPTLSAIDDNFSEAVDGFAYSFMNQSYQFQGSMLEMLAKFAEVANQRLIAASTQARHSPALMNQPATTATADHPLSAEPPRPQVRNSARTTAELASLSTQAMSQASTTQRTLATKNPPASSAPSTIMAKEVQPPDIETASDPSPDYSPIGHFPASAIKQNPGPPDTTAFSGPAPSPPGQRQAAGTPTATETRVHKLVFTGGYEHHVSCLVGDAVSVSWGSGGGSGPMFYLLRGSSPEDLKDQASRFKTFKGMFSRKANPRALASKMHSFSYRFDESGEYAIIGFGGTYDGKGYQRAFIHVSR